MYNHAGKKKTAVRLQPTYLTRVEQGCLGSMKMMKSICIGHFEIEMDSGNSTVSHPPKTGE